MLLFGLLPSEPAAADGSDFTITFRGAEPTDYDHATGLGGNFTGSDPQLNGGDFRCGDKVVYFARIEVDDNPTVASQDIQVNFTFGTQSTGQPGAGFRSLVSASAQAPSDPAHTADGDETVTVVTNNFTGDPALVGVQITDLEASESFILRLVLTLGCDPGLSPTGNIQAALASAFVIPSQDTISTGQQTNPLMQAGQIGQPAIDITKTADAAVVNAGDQIGFTITVTNPGNAAATTVVVTDALPAGPGLDWSLSPAVNGCSITGAIGSEQLVCNLGSIASLGTSGPIHLTSPTTADSCGTVPNTAAVTTGNDGSDQASASIEIRCPDVTVTKEAAPAIITAPGTATFTILVQNLGAGTARNVTLTDTLPPGTWSEDSAACSIAAGVLSCNFGDLASGATVPAITLTRSVDTCAQLPNTAVVSAANEPQAATANNTSSATVTVTCALLSIAKTADDPAVNAGDPVGFTITVINGGDAAAANVVVTDVLPTNAGLNWSLDPAVTGCAITGAVGSQVLNCTLPTVAANGGTLTIHVVSATTPATCGTVANSAALATGTPALASVTVNCPDVTVTKTADDSTINAGQTAAFTIVVRNLGPGTATGVTLSDPLPAGIVWTEDSPDCSIGVSGLTCTFGPLAPGESRTVHLAGPTDVADCGVLSNVATVAATNEPVSNTSNNTDDAGITISCPPPPGYGTDPSTLPEERPYDPIPGQTGGTQEQAPVDPGAGLAGTTVPLIPVAAPSEDSGNPVVDAVLGAVETQVNLPRTGGELVQQAIAGFALVGVGLVLMAVRRRRSASKPA